MSKLAKSKVLAAIRRARGSLRRKPGDKPFAEQRAEQKAEEKALEKGELDRHSNLADRP